MKWLIYFPPEVVLVVKNGNFTFGLLELILTDEVAWSTPFPPVVPSNGHAWWCYISIVRAHIGIWSGRSIPTQYWLIVVKNDNFICVWLQLIFADEVAYLPPLVWASSGEEWWFYNSTFRAHIGRWTGRSTPSSSFYWSLMVILHLYC